jgi:crossover junction endodeoxyribonuclease RuvC
LARKAVRVLGVDTSLRCSGVAVIEQNNHQFCPVYYGTIPNPAKRRHSDCLHTIYTGVTDLIARTDPHAVAVEGIFYCKNVKTAVILGQARGTVLAAAAAAGLPVYEYSPRRVKQAVVGTGTAHKEQVARMIKAMLGLSEQPQADAADALAIALCHLQATTGAAAQELKQI